MYQPYSRCADMLLDTQYHNPKDPRPYDDTGWTLGPLHNVKTVRVTDAKILESAMALLGQDVAIEGRGVGKGKAVAFAVNHTAEPELMTFRYRLKDIKMLAAEDEFTQGGVKFVSWSFLIPAAGNPADLETRLGAAAKDLGLTVYRLAPLPAITHHDLDPPRL